MDMNHTNRRTIKGFSLVEVMIALVVLAVGILGISKLQATMIKNSSNANQRTVAVSIAQKKIDDLRSFASLTTTASTIPATWSAGLTSDKLAYEHIGTNQGGAPAGTTDLVQGNVTVGGFTYTLRWDVTDYWYVAGAASTVEPTTTPLEDMKLATIVVNWDDEAGVNQEVSLSTIIDAYSPSLTALSGDTSTGGQGPKVVHTPGVAPEVIPVCVSGDCSSGGTGLKKETDNPEPEVSQNDQFANVSFSEITYYNGTNIIKKREDFATVNCVCKQIAGDASVTAYEPAYIELAEDDEGYNIIVNKVGNTVSDANRRIGERIASGQNGQQDKLCDACCRDHHDFTGAANKYDPFRPVSDYIAANGDHNHYDSVGNLANDIGDTYVEACKFVRIDGILRVAQDWKQETIKVIPENDLITDISDWQKYTTDFLTEYVNAVVPASYPLATPDVTTFSATLNNERGASTVPYTPSSGEQLISRSIYIDYMPPEIITELQSNGIDFEIIPFHDVNTTKLAVWSSADSGIVSVTTEDLADNNAHSRGVVTPVAQGTTPITASLSNSNSGLANSTSVDIVGDSNASADKIYLNVTAGPPPSPTIIHLTGKVSMSNKTDLDYDEITITATSPGVTCSRTEDLGNNNKTYTYDCSFQANTSGSVTLSGYNPCKLNNKGKLIFSNNVISPTTNTAIFNDGTSAETTVYTASLGADTTLDFSIGNTSSGEVASCP